MPSSDVVGSGEVYTAQIGATAANVGVMFGLTVTVPFADSEMQPVLVFVIITLYVPSTEVVNVTTFPGLFAPAGTVHTYEYVPVWDGVAVIVAEFPSQTLGSLQ